MNLIPRLKSLAFAQQDETASFQASMQELVHSMCIALYGGEQSLFVTGYEGTRDNWKVQNFDLELPSDQMIDMAFLGPVGSSVDANIAALRTLNEAGKGFVVRCPPTWMIVHSDDGSRERLLLRWVSVRSDLDVMGLFQSLKQHHKGVAYLIGCLDRQIGESSLKAAPGNFFGPKALRRR